MSVAEEVKKGKLVIVTSRSCLGKVRPKNVGDSNRVAVVVVD